MEWIVLQVVINAISTKDCFKVLSLPCMVLLFYETLYLITGI